MYVCIFVCVCSLTLWCQPLRFLPALARHDPSVTFLLPSLLLSLPLRSHPSLPSLLFLYICLRPLPLPASTIHHTLTRFLLLLSPLLPKEAPFFCFPAHFSLVGSSFSSVPSSSAFHSFFFCLSSVSAFVCLQTTRLKEMKMKTCGHSGLCNKNNKSHHQKITHSGPPAFFHWSPSYLRLM